MPDARGGEDRRSALLADTFAVLDQKRRGFISRVELSHILDAMQADTSVKFTVPEALVPTNSMKDSRVSLSDLRKYLEKLSIADLEDVKWFAESVVRVESELREIWRAAAQRWRERVEGLYRRDLHRYLLTSQPERVARWLLLRTSMAEVNKGDGIGLLGLGISQQEVEVLFTDETADDINRCGDKIEPFLSAFELRQQLEEACLKGELSERCSEEQDGIVAELLSKLVQHAETGRELACLLIHEDTLDFATRLVRCCAFSPEVVSQASKLIMALLSYRVQENARDYEKLCRQAVADYVEIGFDLGGLRPREEVKRLHSPVKAGRLSLVCNAGEPKEKISDWVGSLLTLSADLSRGEMLDVLIKFDERRLLLASDGGERRDESAPVAVSLFAYGRTVPHVLGRLDVSSHHSLHEHRTPMRTHLWKLLLNVLSSAGDLGRRLFRAAEGMRVVCSIVRGNSWGAEREEISLEEEEDRCEEEKLLRRGGRDVWGLKDPFNSWPYVECPDEFVHEHEHRYYSMDFIDDKFYGSKDRMLASAFLEYMASDALWGEELLVEEMMQYPNTLQTFSRVRPRADGGGCILLRVLLNSPGFPAYLQDVATRIAESFAARSLNATCVADVTCHSLFPVSYNLGEGGGAGPAALESFRKELVSTETTNIMLRILSHAYHSLQASLQLERSGREADAAQAEEGRAAPSQLEEEISGCCELLASRLPLTLEEVGDISVSIYTQVKDFTRKALLVGSRLPPVGSSEGAAECAEATEAQPRPGSSGLEKKPLLQSQYLNEPSFFPYEFLVVLRLVQLIRLREPSLPPFVVELQELLEQLAGQTPASGAHRREDREVAGKEYPWRTGLVELKSFHVSQAPLRRSLLRKFPRQCPVDILHGLESALRDYSELGAWPDDEAGDQEGAHAKDPQQLEALAARRSTLLALVLNHLCYYHPKVVALEDSSLGLSMRLGLTNELLHATRAVLERPPLAGLRSGAEFASAFLPEGGSCRVFRGTPAGAVVVVEVSTGSGKVAFVCLRGAWMLWANCTEDAAQVLSDSCSVRDYFAFDAGAARD